MANHKSSIKRTRSNEAKRLRNRYQAKTARTVIKKIRTATAKSAVEKDLPKVVSMLDKLAKRKIIHKKKASNLKSKLVRFVNSLK